MSLVELIHPEARRVIGKPHPNTRPALTMLEKEGFIWVVEAQNKKGWRQIVEQHFTPLG